MTTDEIVGMIISAFTMDHNPPALLGQLSMVVHGVVEYFIVTCNKAQCNSLLVSHSQQFKSRNQELQ